MRYLPHTSAEIESMLSSIGMKEISDLFASIPRENVAAPMNLEPALAEPALMRHLTELANKNSTSALSFLGYGMYDHHIPPAVDQLLLRSEFYTAYTPYQAEVSQGTLQAIFEFQTIVCELFDMEVANASMYCMSSAVAEATLMARRLTKRRKIVMSGAVHPDARGATHTYLSAVDSGNPAMLVIAPENHTTPGVLDAIDAETAAVVVGYPNVFGAFEDLETIVAKAHENGALVITATSEPYALSVAKAPGSFGVDICVGEGQALAAPPQYGGPGVGLLAARKSMVRQLPGRLVGQTVDQDGERGFVLTLSTREQHIRREKATSNICTNHGLIALSMAIRTAMLGRQGFTQAGEICMRNARFLAAEIDAIDGLSCPLKSKPHFNEFIVRRTGGKPARELLTKLAERSILGGVACDFDHGDASEFLVAVTEKHDREALDTLIEALKELA